MIAGDTVNLANKMESSGEGNLRRGMRECFRLIMMNTFYPAGKIQMSPDAKALMEQYPGVYRVEERGPVEIKVGWHESAACKGGAEKADCRVWAS
jgi:hypothetical protein